MAMKAQMLRGELYRFDINFRESAVVGIVRRFALRWRFE